MRPAILPCRLELAERTNDAVPKLKHPTVQTKLFWLLRLCNIFRRLVPNFASFAALLNKKLWKCESKQFGTQDENENAEIVSLKKALKRLLVPALSRSEGRFPLETDDCD